MYEKCKARLKMVRVILKDGYLDEASYSCQVIRYQKEEESIYLLTETDLPAFSLDGIYECRIDTPDGTVACTGMILERYWNELGNVIKFRIQNGFYKNLVN
ncbi:hypothetical protein H6A17_12855 [Mordavella massiliensis]|nr:hypothetical protein [Mordavella massiliensis]